MRCDLVSFRDHAPDQIGVGSSEVDRALSIIVPCYKKCGVETVKFKGIEELCRVNIWSIIVSQSHYILLNTVVDVIFVRDCSFGWTGDILR